MVLKKRPRSSDSISVSTSDDSTRVEVVQKLRDRLHENMEELYLEEKLIDITLLVEDRRIPAHKIVLASASPFFKAMFTSGMEESRASEVRLPTLDPDAVHSIVSYMYTGDLFISGDNVMAVLFASNLFEMLDVVKQCCCKLVSEMNPHNCLDIMEAAEMFQSRAECQKLYSTTNEYVQNYFITAVRHTDSFLNLPINRLVDLLTRDDLVVLKEQYVCEAALSWLTYDLQSRMSFASEVLSCIRFPMLDENYIKSFTTTLTSPRHHNTTTSSSTSCDNSNVEKALLAELSSMIIRKNESTNKTSSTSSMIMDKEQARRKGMKSLYAIGGCDGKKASRTMETYDPITDTWHILSPMSEKRSYFGTAIADGRIFAAGGHNDSKHLNSVEVYDPKLRSWTSAPPMSAIRSYLGVVFLNGFVYAIGGYDGESHTNTAERFNVSTGSWESIASLNVPRSGLAATVVGGSIYVVGGFDGRAHLSSAERYDVVTNTWIEIAEMTQVRNGPGAVELDGMLHVIGGEFKHGKRVRTAEIYDPSLNSWSSAGPMLECTSGHGVASIHDMWLYSVGGSNQDNNYLRSTYRYDVMSGRWVCLAPMKEMRCGLSVTVLDSVVPAIALEQPVAAMRRGTLSSFDRTSAA